MHWIMISGSCESVGDLESNTHTDLWFFSIVRLKRVMVLISIRIEQTLIHWCCIQYTWTSSSFFRPEETQMRNASWVWALYSQKPSLLQKTIQNRVDIHRFTFLKTRQRSWTCSSDHWSSALNRLFQDQLSSAIKTPSDRPLHAEKIFLWSAFGDFEHKDWISFPKLWKLSWRQNESLNLKSLNLIRHAFTQASNLQWSMFYIFTIKSDDWYNHS